MIQIYDTVTGWCACQWIQAMHWLQHLTIWPTPGPPADLSVCAASLETLGFLYTQASCLYMMYIQARPPKRHKQCCSPPDASQTLELSQYCCDGAGLVATVPSTSRGGLPDLKLLHGIVHDVNQEVCICLVEAHRWLDAEHIAVYSPLAHEHSHVFHALKHLCQLSSSGSLQQQTGAG